MAQTIHPPRSRGNVFRRNCNFGTSTLNWAQLIEALTAGMEVMIRISEAMGPRNLYQRGFHPTSVCGPFGRAIAAGRALGLGPSKMAEAISTAAVQGAGSSIWAGAATPPAFLVQIGWAAESGVLAALLAEQGCYGVDRIFEDARGVADVVFR